MMRVPYDLEDIDFCVDLDTIDPDEGVWWYCEQCGLFFRSDTFDVYYVVNHPPTLDGVVVFDSCPFCDPVGD